MIEASASLDALPVLQHTLMRMAEPHIVAGTARWELTLADYDRVTTDPEGVRRNALSVHADEVRRRLVGTPEAAAMADVVDTVFRALLDVDAGGQMVRRPTDLATLKALAGRHASLVERVIEAYEQEGVNLLVRNVDPESGRALIDISHEALLRNWWRMNVGPNGTGLGWIGQERDDALSWRTLARNAAVPKARIDPQLLVQLASFVLRVTSAPERARRYLIVSESKPSVEDEPEWRSVMLFVAAGHRRRRVIRVLLGLLALLVAGLVVAVLIGQSNDITAQQEQIEQKNREITAGNEADVVQAVVEPSAAAERQDSYMWIGDKSVTNLVDPGTKRMTLPDQVIPEGRYQVTRNVTLRSGLPTGENNSAPRVGAVKAGSFVTALGAPELWTSSGQFWLQVDPGARSTVYIQYAAGSPKVLRDVLENSDYDVPREERLASAARYYEVRYCRPEQKAAAEQVAAIIGGALGRLPAAKRIGRANACERVSGLDVIEVWIGNPQSPPADAAAAALDAGADNAD
jgi:hypothetical protein